MKKNIFLSIVMTCIVIGGLLHAQKNILLSAKSFAGKISGENKEIVIDTRSQEEYAENHIPLAKLLEIANNDTIALLNTLDKTQTILLYSIGNGRSVVWAKLLRSKGFKKSYALDGGIGSWVGAGYAFDATSATNIWTLDSLEQWKRTNHLLLIEAGSRHCPPCVKLRPILSKLKENSNNEFSLRLVDLNDNPRLITNIGNIVLLPTIILYKDGVEVWRQSGVDNFDEIENKIVTQINNNHK